MKLDKIFKMLIDVAFYSLLPAAIFSPGVLLYMLIFPEQSIVDIDLPFLENGFGFPALMVTIWYFAEYLLFAIGFYHLRKFAGLLLKKSTFSTGVIYHSKKIGRFFSRCALSGLLLNLFLSFFRHSAPTRINIVANGYILFLFLLIIGVLFLLLSNAFEKALGMKAENDLTV